jgi:cytochrome oxidase Cu insertion factor (SCO1/SenC/PrrC family)
LPAVSLPTADGSPSGTGFLRGKWTMLYVGDGTCDERCRKALYLTRQSRIALNKDMDRIQRVLLATGPQLDGAFFAQEHPDLLVLKLHGPDAARFIEPIPSYADGPVGSAGRIYLVDPLGNLLMSYPASAPDKALLTDVKKLLRLSHIG